ncbi:MULTISPECIES: hypothetical protein [Thioalkalivibrio]|uniref:Uncharacterized protein n=1 Tax=Thioalkalivibrio halophilus TaxID=252474 RepID=A0A1V3A1R0_9GAMM|nr:MULTISPECIES: hypothetical protein [Thioalkalivibrio]OOC11239.1 hypothetical protein B1A74_01635 [Thioalkalivibrio halophilus]PYG00723.1 hypothetical protein D893_02327 [Thioalkalivibrio sp. ALE21]
MTDDYRPPLADYWDELESRYGGGFNFQQISREELDQLIGHLRQAVNQDPQVTEVEKQNLALVLKHAEESRKRRKG